MEEEVVVSCTFRFDSIWTMKKKNLTTKTTKMTMKTEAFASKNVFDTE